MFGAYGADVLRGEAGRDYLFEGREFVVSKEGSKDVLEGGEDEDFLYAVNEPAAEDAVGCGPGVDTAEVDSADRVSGDCEEVHRR
jgi:hemolysin type calcium-binding protein